MNLSKKIRGGSKMKKLIFLLLMLGSMYARNCVDVGSHGQWCYEQSTLQAFYFLEDIAIDGESVDPNDLVGALKDGIIVGFFAADPVGYTTIPLMGNDGGSGQVDYMLPGDVASLVYFDASNDVILSLTPGSELPGWGVNASFIIDGISTANNIFGCTDSSACNYNSSATADDASCAVSDCSGECGGSASVDECGECGGPGILVGECDCAGNVIDCNSECGGSSTNDVCGECDGDGSSCLGCTTDCADNYDSNAVWDDGSQCDYTVPKISNLSAASGASRVILSWDEPVADCDLTYSYDVIDDSGVFVKSTSATTTQVVGLDAGVEYCFGIQAVADVGSSGTSELACATAGEDVGCITWGLKVRADINGWGQFEASDESNKLGVGPSSTYSYDSACDIPEPVSGTENYISLYFPHDEWDSQWGANFTQDVVTEDDEFFEHNLTTWDVEVTSNMSGEASVTFDHLGSVLIGDYGFIPMYVEVMPQDVNNSDASTAFHSITDGSSVDFFLSQGSVQRLRVHIGNVVPTVAQSALSADGGDRSIALNWDESLGRYPANSYTLYREEGHGSDDAIEHASSIDQDGVAYDDIEDREGHDGQGLLYESTWGYTVTASNDAGESTDGYQVWASGGSIDIIDGTQSDASATTDDNLDPVAVLGQHGCYDFATQSACDGSGGVYSPIHDGSSDENTNDINVVGDESYDADEFDGITRYTWSLDGDSYGESGHSTSMLTWLTGNVHEAETKNYTATLLVESDYPIRGGIDTRSDSNSIDVSLSEEPNTDPVASAGLDLVEPGDGNSVSTMVDFHDSDNNDYDAGGADGSDLGVGQKWYVPHDGDPSSDVASLYFDASDSYDADEVDELTYEFFLTAGDINPDYLYYEDLNDNGSYDLGEPFNWDAGPNQNEDEIYTTTLSVSNSITYSSDLPADVYILEMVVTDSYGDSNSSTIWLGVEGERNEGPTLSVGDDQQWYMNTDEDSKDISMSVHSVDDTDSDGLAYSWSYDGPGIDGGQASTGGELPQYPSLSNDQSLVEGDHAFTLSVSDNYGASASASFSIFIDNEPAAISPVELYVVEPYFAFKHIEINWNEGVLDAADFERETDYDGDGVAEAHSYTGDLHNTLYFRVYMNGELRGQYENDAGEGYTYSHHEESLPAGTDHSFTVESFNSDDEGDSNSDAFHRTHDRPTVTVINPNGSEIHTFNDVRFDNDDYTVEFTTTNDRFIAKKDIEFLSQNGWVDEDDDETFEGGAELDEANLGSYSANVDSDGSEIYHDASIRITLTDIGDFNGENVQSLDDSSDNPFSLAAHALSYSFSEGWNMFGSAMDIGGAESTLMNDNIGSLGAWGTDWLVFDDTGAYEDLSLTHGEGFYLALSGTSTDLISLEYGQPVTGDPGNGDTFASLDLSDGWNLISNPLITEVDKEDIYVASEGVSLAWEDAVDAGWVAPTINGWFNDSHQAYDRLQAWSGYWVNVSRDLSLSFAPVESGLARESSTDNMWTLKLNARDAQDNASGDYIKIGLSQDANSNFKYGEDEYDIPNPANTSMIDMHINNSDWVGSKDVNGINVDAPYFFSDIRSTDYDEYQAWNISANRYNVNSSIELSWIAPEDMDADVHLVVNGNAIDMKVETSIQIEDINSMSVVVGNVDSFMNPVPELFALSAAYPNPFNPSTSLNLDLNQDGFVSVKVYNVVGQVVAELANGHMKAGYHTFTWNAGSIASGMYLVRVEAGAHIATQKLMLLK